MSPLRSTPRPVRAAALALSLALGATLFPGAAPPALAQISEAPLNLDSRDALRAEIRAYLLDNPEVIFEAVAEYERRTEAAQAEMDGVLVAINAEDIFDDGYSYVGGNPEGDLTLVEFMDYRCAFCRRAYPEMVEFLEADSNVRLVVKEFPILGPQSELMSRFAVAVHQIGGDAPYYAAHGRLLALQEDATEAGLRALAEELGLDGEAVLARMPTREVTEVLTRNRELAQRLQISGTPSFILGDGTGGEMLRGMVPARELGRVATELRG